MTIRIAWSDPNGPLTQEDEVRIYRDTTPFDAGSLPAVLATLAADVESYDDATAVADTSYWYAVGFEKNGRLVLDFTSNVYLTAALFSESAAFFAPSVNLTAQMINPALFSETGGFFAATLALGDAVLTPALFSESGAFFGAMITAPGGWSGAWATPLEGALSSTSPNWHNYTIRNYINRSILPGSASKVRITFSALAGGATRIAKAYAGLSRGNTFDVAPSQLLFSGNPGVTVAAGSDVVSDELTLGWNGTGDLCVSFHIPSDAGSNGYLAQRNSPQLVGGYAVTGDAANTLGGSFSRGSITYGVKKVEMYTEGAWRTIFNPSNGISGTWWNSYTLRSKINVGQFTLTKTKVRFGLLARSSDVFIGKSAGGASPFDFAATPTRLTFGGLNNTSAEDYLTNITDEFDLNAFGVEADLLFSFYVTGNNVAHKASPPSGLSTRYKAGNNASNVTWQSGSSAWSAYIGPSFIDEKF